ncbi:MULTISPECIES: nitroreductase [unclassified Methanoculleus]|jgi:nitroreductase|uniref:nitroreductase family protein n=1 Tax=unclassified Methanoculleus TaxID=2619537 RepID=UPI0025F9BAE5|nr:MULTISPECIES: nitroreductase [unclassified Methanoculleus]MCK9316890.1 nitroreductase [Methanoculleus sp.]MDD2253328.1 nitroreductase [Methanoculleus sp.]MDD2787515.1 nitroreductase [Methanoculleus sp.]MDD3215094.1 nitroreductase [Methanoculleus sp.]MDD4313108.1 nitroreductase [Methanoculleus sp.]
MMTEPETIGIFSVIRERRSVRNYTDREVPDEALRAIIAAGIQAPTALGFQPWQFVVVRDRDLMQRASDYCKPLLLEKIGAEPRPGMEEFLAALENPEFSIFYNAPVLVLVLGARDAVSSVLDCTLCAENMMLAAWALGIGSCWVGAATLVEQNPGLRAALKVPDDHQVVAPLIFGYPAPLPPKPARREPRIAWVP